MEIVLQGSNATQEFKAGLRSYLSGERSDRVKVESPVPRVKVRRLLTHLLSAEPSLPIEKVTVTGVSGCSDFVGSVKVDTATGPLAFDFRWCCRWRAETEGYVDYFGFPDQMRAAQEFDWRCFERWERRDSN